MVFSDSKNNELTFVNKSTAMTAKIPTKKVEIYDHCFSVLFAVSMLLCSEHSALAQRIEETMELFARSRESMQG